MPQVCTKLFATAITTVLLLGVGLISPFGLVVSVQAGSLEDQLAQIEKDLANIRASKNSIQSQISQSQSQINQYSGSIGKLRGELETLEISGQELELQLKELNINVDLLNQQIDSKKEEIDSNQQIADNLEQQAEDRIKDDYMSLRARGMSNVDFLPSRNPNAYFKDSQYKDIIHQEINKSLQDLEDLRAKLEIDKQALDDKTTEVVRNKEIVAEETAQLERMKADISAKIKSYYGLVYQSQSKIQSEKNVLGAMSDQEAKKLAEQELVRQRIFNNIGSFKSGTYVLKGTIIGLQGSTGWSTGPHLHFGVKYNGVVLNPCIYLPSNFVAGCGGNGRLGAPMKGTYYYTSRFYSGVNGDLRCIPGSGCMSHPAIDVANVIWNTPIYAAHNGWIQKGVDQYGANYIILCEDKNNTRNGFCTSYWHLSKF